MIQPKTIIHLQSPELMVIILMFTLHVAIPEQKMLYIKSIISTRR